MFHQFIPENDQINFGQCTRIGCDREVMRNEMKDSINPMLERFDLLRYFNCNGCHSTMGPRSASGASSYGVSNLDKIDQMYPSQKMVDLESNLTNRTLRRHGSRRGLVNTTDIHSYELHHKPDCNRFLDPLSTRLTDPVQNYRGVTINRFYDPHRPPQLNIFTDFGINTQLEARDNYKEEMPESIDPYLSWPKPCKKKRKRK